MYIYIFIFIYLFIYLFIYVLIFDVNEHPRFWRIVHGWSGELHGLWRWLSQPDKSREPKSDPEHTGDWCVWSGPDIQPFLVEHDRQFVESTMEGGQGLMTLTYCFAVLDRTWPCWKGPVSCGGSVAQKHG